MLFCFLINYANSTSAPASVNWSAIVLASSAGIFSLIFPPLSAISLDSLSPLKIMGRGYTLIKKDHQLIVESKQLSKDDDIEILKGGKEIREPGGSNGKDSSCQCRKREFNPRVR